MVARVEVLVGVLVDGRAGRVAIVVRRRQPHRGDAERVEVRDLLGDAPQVAAFVLAGGARRRVAPRGAVHRLRLSVAVVEAVDHREVHHRVAPIEDLEVAAGPGQRLAALEGQKRVEAAEGVVDLLRVPRIRNPLRLVAARDHVFVLVAPVVEPRSGVPDAALVGEGHRQTALRDGGRPAVELARDVHRVGSVVARVVDEDVLIARLVRAQPLGAALGEDVAIRGLGALGRAALEVEAERLIFAVVVAQALRAAAPVAAHERVVARVLRVAFRVGRRRAAPVLLAAVVAAEWGVLGTVGVAKAARLERADMLRDRVLAARAIVFARRVVRIRDPRAVDHEFVSVAPGREGDVGEVEALAHVGQRDGALPAFERAGELHFGGRRVPGVAVDEGPDAAGGAPVVAHRSVGRDPRVLARLTGPRVVRIVVEAACKAGQNQSVSQHCVTHATRSGGTG